MLELSEENLEKMHKGRVKKKRKKIGEFSTKRLTPPPPVSGKKIKKRKMIYAS